MLTSVQLAAVAGLLIPFFTPLSDRPRASLPAALDGRQILEGWQQLELQPPVRIGSGELLSCESSRAVHEALLAREEDSALVMRLWELGVDPDEMVYLRMRPERGAARRGTRATSDLAALGTELVRAAAPGATPLADLELWVGGTTDTTAPISVSTALLMGIGADGERRLVLGLVAQVSGGETVGEPEEVFGSWLYEAYSEEERAADDGDGAAELGVAATLAPARGKLKKAARNYAACFRQCFRTVAPFLTPFQTACVVYAAVACIGATAGWPACFTLGVIACGLAPHLLLLLGCAVNCL